MGGVKCFNNVTEISSSRHCAEGATPYRPKRRVTIVRCPAHDADTIADALIAYLDTGAAPGTITLENTFVAGSF